jgi:hypothetical protein
MANLVAQWSRFHAHAIRNAMRNGNYHEAENQLATLRHSLPVSSGGTPGGIHALRLPLHAYIHGILRHHQPLDSALREVRWMLTSGCRIRRNTIKAAFSSALRREGKNEEKKIEEKTDNGGSSEVSSDLHADLFVNQHLGMAVEVLRLFRMNERTGPTMFTVEIFQSMVKACLEKDEFVAAALVVEMLIEDWATWLSAAAAMPAAADVSASVSSVTPRETPLRPANSEFLTPSEFADQSHYTFHLLCHGSKTKLFSAKTQRGGSVEEMAKADRLLSHIPQAVCILVSLFDLRLLPYHNIYRLLDVVNLCTRVPSCDVLVRNDRLTDHVLVDSHTYLRRAVTSLIMDLSSTNLSSIPEINQVLRRERIPLPTFNKLSYRKLLHLAFGIYGDVNLAKKVIHPMVRDERTRRITLDKQMCDILTNRPMKLKMLGLDSVVYNYVWNQSGMEPPQPALHTQSINWEEMTEETTMVGPN